MSRTKRPPPDKELMLDLAKLYAAGNSYASTGKQLRISSRNVAALTKKSVSWLLKEQKRLARLTPSQSLYRDLVLRLRTRFKHLKDVRIVGTGPVATDEQYEALVEKWGIAAADYLDELIDENEQAERKTHIGISGGETVLEVVNQLPERERPKTTFYSVALVGRGTLENSSHVGPETNATIAWSRSGRLPGKCHYGTVQPYDNSQISKLNPKERRVEIDEEVAFAADLPSVKEVLARIERAKLDIVVASLGMIREHQELSEKRNLVTMMGLLTSLGVTSAELRREGAVGDFCYCVISDDGDDQPKVSPGTELPKERWWRFFVTAGHGSELSGIRYYQELVRLGKIVILIAGARKEEAIRAALRARTFNVWFTDEHTARQILKKHD